MALLGVLAMAGYQNRDKLAEMLGNAGGRRGPAGEGGRDGGAFGGLGEGLRDLVDRFRQGGHGETADSWVNHGPNRSLAPGQLEQVLDEETLEAISRQTGLPRNEVIARLMRDLPDAVDRYTPDGRLPG
jgi:uncharacterized protein YidB (DUF937 family)